MQLPNKASNTVKVQAIKFKVFNTLQHTRLEFLKRKKIEIKRNKKKTFYFELKISIIFCKILHTN